MLKRKYVVQKSVRLDEQLANDLEVLSKILERPQNELLNIALENLMIENKFWFAQNIIVDFFSEFLHSGQEPHVFDVQGLHIGMKKDTEKKSFIICVKRKDASGNIIEDFEKKFKSRDEVEAELREYARYLEFTPEIENYLNHRLNYRSKSEMWTFL